MVLGFVAVQIGGALLAVWIAHQISGEVAKHRQWAIEKELASHATQ
jgi:hypothetical protein